MTENETIIELDVAVQPTGGILRSLEVIVQPDVTKVSVVKDEHCGKAQHVVSAQFVKKDGTRHTADLNEICKDNGIPGTVELYHTRRDTTDTTMPSIRYPVETDLQICFPGISGLSPDDVSIVAKMDSTPYTTIEEYIKSIGKKAKLEVPSSTKNNAPKLVDCYLAPANSALMLLIECHSEWNRYSWDIPYPDSVANATMGTGIAYAGVSNEQLCRVLYSESPSPDLVKIRAHLEKILCAHKAFADIQKVRLDFSIPKIDRVYIARLKFHRTKDQTSDGNNELHPKLEEWTAFNSVK